MLDLNFIRQNPSAVKKACQNKGIETKIIDLLLEVDKNRRDLIIQSQALREKRNILVSDLKSKPSAEKISHGKELKGKLTKLEIELEAVEQKYNQLLAQVPNIPSSDVPIGDKPKIVRTWGKIPKFDFKIKDHIQIAKDLDLIDFDRGSKVVGFRGYFLKNEAVLLHLGLMDWVLKKLVKTGFTPFSAPVVDKKECFFYTGHFPWGEKEAYKLADDQYLAGTAEVPMIAYHADETLSEKQLPLKYVAFSPCFRREIGSYGKDTKGLYRLHEFLKIEQIIICKNDLKESLSWLEKLSAISEEVLQELKLPYRVCLMPTSDMGEPQAKKYDLEAWMPGRKEYGEVMSDSMMLDFQARRANIKYTTAEGKRLYVHTLNNTAIASPRILIALLENYQQKDGSVRIPKVLQAYIGKDKINR